MKIKELTKQQLIYLLFNPNPCFYGDFGIISLIDNKLYKIYYKDLIITYTSRDVNELDNEVDTLLEIEHITNFGLRNPKSCLEKFLRLQDTASNKLITNILSYKGLLVGVEMKYYKDFLELNEVLELLDEKSLKKCLNRILYLIKDLLNNNIIVRDIKENNILVNPTTLEVVLIDLDGKETVYGPRNYVKNYPYNEELTINNFYEMVNRLEKKKQKNIQNVWNTNVDIVLGGHLWRRI